MADASLAAATGTGDSLSHQGRPAGVGSTDLYFGLEGMRHMSPVAGAKRAKLHRLGCLGTLTCLGGDLFGDPK